MLTIAVLLLAQTIGTADTAPVYPLFVPGEINPAVTQETISKTICVSGWTTTVRPPAKYTDALKRVQMREFGLKGKPASYEEDHGLPLGSGGHPTSRKNLGPQAAPMFHWKDRLEKAVQKDICSGDHGRKPGRLTLAEGQAIFLGDWYAEYVKRYGKHK